MNTKSLFLALITVIIWGSTFTSISISLRGGYSAGHLLLFRFIIASIMFIIIAMIPKYNFRLPAKEDLISIIFLGLIGISGYHVFNTFGQLTVAAGTAGMLIGSAPIFTTILAILVLKERLGKLGWCGLILGFIGITLIALGSGDTMFDISPGLFLILLAAVATSIFFVYQKALFQKYTALELTAYFTWVGTIPFFIFTPGLLTTIQAATTEATISAIYIGIFPTAIAYLTWAIALSSTKASSISSVLYLEPIIAIIVAWILLNELPSVISLVGGVITISGVLIVAFLGKKKSLTNQRKENKVEAVTNM